MDIPTGRQVVIKTANSTWTPTIAEAQGGFPAIQAYLEKCRNADHVDAVIGAGSEKRRAWIASQVCLILANKSGYRVQIWGVTAEGKRVIVYNFFPAAEEGSSEAFSYWRREKVEVCDGGYFFWQVSYDPKAKAVMLFDSNGYAMTSPGVAGSLRVAIAAQVRP